jgi:hypothetical protein
MLFPCPKTYFNFPGLSTKPSVSGTEPLGGCPPTRKRARFVRNGRLGEAFKSLYGLSEALERVTLVHASGSKVASEGEAGSAAEAYR